MKKLLMLISKVFKENYLIYANRFYKEQEQINLGKLRKESLDWIEANL